MLLRTLSVLAFDNIESELSSDVAESDAEGLEHHLSEETLAAMRAFAAKAPSG